MDFEAIEKLVNSAKHLRMFKPQSSQVTEFRSHPPNNNLYLTGQSKRFQEKVRSYILKAIEEELSLLEEDLRIQLQIADLDKEEEFQQAKDRSLESQKQTLDELSKES